MKYHVIIEGIDPAPERTMQSSGQYIEGCRIWAKSNLDALPADKRHVNAEAVIYEEKLVEVERIKRKGPVIELQDELAKIVEDIRLTLTSEKTLIDVIAKIQQVMEKTK